jgi:acyl-homoserine-lactone acylase
MPRFVLKASTAILAVAATLGAVTASAQTKYTAEVRRTSYGIAHIKANDYGSIGYGVGYAYAQDNICMIADRFVSVRGERSRYFGAAGSDFAGINNLANDFFYAYFNGDTAVLTAGLARMKPDVQAGFKGWVAGYNRYLKDTGVANLPAPCKGAAWVRPIDDVDMMRLVRSIAIMAGSAGNGSFIGAFAITNPPATTSAATGKSAEEHEALDGLRNRDFLREYEATRHELGSNAVGLGADATDNRRGMLLGTPHFPWVGNLRFSEFHLTVPNQVDVMGVTVSGLPFLIIGFNKDVAWSHTVDAANHFAAYILALDPANPLRYMYDGQYRDMTTKTVTVQALQANGSLVPVSKTFYSTVHGTVIAAPPVFSWTKTSVVSLADANLDNWRVADQLFDVNRATSTVDIESALDRNLGIPFLNTIAADKDGNAFYAVISAVPNVDRFQQSFCTPSAALAGGFARVAFEGTSFVGQSILILDGTRSACLPAVDSASPQAGLLPGKRMPRLHTQSYVQNSNDSYWLTNPAYNLYSFNVPAVVGIVPEQQNLRTRLGVPQILARLSNADGLGGNTFTLPMLQQIALSNRSYAADVFLPDLLTLCGTDAAASVSSLCDVLRAWDRKFEMTSKGAHLFQEFFLNVVGGDTTGRFPTIANVYTVPFDFTNPLTTPRGLNITNPTVAAALVNALAAAGKKITDAGLKVDAALGTIQFGIQLRDSGGTTIVPVHGGGGTPLGIYNSIYSTLVPGIGYIVNYGTSYIQTVQFTDTGVNAQAFLTYSQSTNPASPNFADQTARFAAKQWITLPFTESAITSDPGYRTSTISE